MGFFREQTVFVTGGSGFLGLNLIRHLRARGATVHALVRSSQSAAVVQALGAMPIVGDLDTTALLVGGMQGCTVVFHAAASVASWGDEAAAYRTNVIGTEQVVAAARTAGVPRLVHVSTEAVLAGGAPIIQADETHPLPHNPVGIYPRTKGIAEERVLAANSPTLTTIIVRPRLIWGNDDTTFLPRLIQAVQTGHYVWFDNGQYLTSTCHVDNVCTGMLAAAERGQPRAIYFLTDGAPVELRAFITALLASRGVTPGGRSLPRWLGAWIARCGEWVWRRFDLRSQQPLTRTEFNLFGGEVTVRDDKARRDIGYVPIISMEAGIAALHPSPRV